MQAFHVPYCSADVIRSLAKTSLQLRSLFVSPSDLEQRITGGDLMALTNACRFLEKLSLGNSSFGSVPEIVALVANCPTLRILHLGVLRIGHSIGITDRAVAELRERCSKLEKYSWSEQMDA